MPVGWESELTSRPIGCCGVWAGGESVYDESTLLELTRAAEPTQGAAFRGSLTLLTRLR